MNYKLTLAFDGKEYSGWQFQKNAPTVQGKLTEVANKFFSSSATVTGCSRTDSGVHAENYVCNVKTDREISPTGVVKGMNTFLPPDIVIKECEIVPDTFHARYDCKSKEYRYKILNTETRDPFLASRVLHFPQPLDVEKMKKDAESLVGKHDFVSFMATGSKITDTVRTIYKAEVEENDGIITFSVSADGFLYNMVRIIVGTLIDVNLNRTSLTIKEIIEKKDRTYAGFTAGPSGLYLYKAEY
ncbi:MAG: tRNA pseudouridine(38-40) synthase TruA [Ruminococcaceae bacterium]|nr:tRNA pseudouridine(38-40) synthase TruA [Oscillospiraceae bacterium]